MIRSDPQGPPRPVWSPGAWGDGVGQTPPLESVPGGAAWAGLGRGRRREGGEGGAGPLSMALVLVGGRGGCGASQAACSHSRELSALPWRWPGLGPRPPGPWPPSCCGFCSWLLSSPCWVVSWDTSLGVGVGDWGRVCLPKQIPWPRGCLCGCQARLWGWAQAKMWVQRGALCRPPCVEGSVSGLGALLCGRGAWVCCECAWGCGVLTVGV